jgi:hypothetical protein
MLSDQFSSRTGNTAAAALLRRFADLLPHSDDRALRDLVAGVEFQRQLGRSDSLLRVGGDPGQPEQRLSVGGLLQKRIPQPIAALPLLARAVELNCLSDLCGVATSLHCVYGSPL